MSATEPVRNPGVAIERRDVPLTLVAALAGGLVLFCIVSAFALTAIYPSALTGPSDAPRIETAPPRLQIDLAVDLAAYRTKENRQLAGYGWVDRSRGIVRIPVEQAMRDVAAAGIKDWPENAK
jgi:hypothetical protein